VTYQAPLANLNAEGWDDSSSHWLPYSLKTRHFKQAITDLYEFFQAINSVLARDIGLDWHEHLFRPAAVSNIVSDFMQAALARHSPALVMNRFHNGHPDLIPSNTYENDSIKAGSEGLEIKATKRSVADTHGARDGWICQFNYWVDHRTTVRDKRHPTIITRVFVAKIDKSAFRRNPRMTPIGTHTSTLNRDGLAQLRGGVIYKDARFSDTNRLILPKDLKLEEL